MHEHPSLAIYLLGVAVVFRAAAGLFLHGLRRPGRPACIRRDGRVLPR